ncbi:hypothetical protein F4802DRAFT_564566 [Xylaria palmicola]|nr:hypothetical protein F4802DRAFT_564566 [Xylaria palmicola]
MKSTTIVCSLFAALAGATATNDELAAMIPPCAQGCLAEGYKAFKCGPTDYQCQCVNEGAIFNMTDACLDSSCTTQDQKNSMFSSESAHPTMLCTSRKGTRAVRHSDIDVLTRDLDRAGRVHHTTLRRCCSADEP